MTLHINGMGIIPAASYIPNVPATTPTCVPVGPLQPGEVLCGTDLYGDTVGNVTPSTIPQPAAPPGCMVGDTLTVDADGNYLCVTAPSGSTSTIPVWAWAALGVFALVMIAKK